MKRIWNTVVVIWNHPQPWKKITTGIRHRKDKFFGQRWCARRSVDVDTALIKITGVLPDVSFKERFSAELATAERRIAQVPVVMGGSASLDLLYTLCRRIQAKTVVETGVAYGWSSLALLLAIQDKAAGVVYSIDLPYSKATAAYAGCVVPDRLKAKWNFIQKSDRETLPEILKQAGQIDLCHYDSDKTYEGRMFGYTLLWDSMRAGGIFISDDVGDNLAFRDFTHAHDAKPIVVQEAGRYIGIVIKH